MKNVFNIILLVLLSQSVDGATLRFCAGGLICCWDDADKMGFITDKGLQMQFSVSSLSPDSHIALVTGSGWLLKEATTYYAYAPYRSSYSVAENTADALPMDFSQQRQIGNDNTDHLVDCAFYMGSVHVGNASNVALKLRPATSVVRVSEKFSVPLTVREIVMSVGDYLFPLVGGMNLLKGCFESSGNASSISLKLTDVFVGNGDSLVAYFALPPCNLEGESLELSFITDEGVKFKRLLRGFDIQPGKTYCIGTEYAPTMAQTYTSTYSGTKSSPLVAVEDMPIAASFVATGIADCRYETSAAKEYDMAGRSITGAYKGIGIRNRTKILKRQ